MLRTGNRSTESRVKAASLPGEAPIFVRQQVAETEVVITELTTASRTHFIRKFATVFAGLTLTPSSGKPRLRVSANAAAWA